jgi:hypothetical protein
VRPGKRHANADHLSRLTNILGNEPINDALPDVELFVVEVISPNYSDLFQYLIFQTFSFHFTDKLKKQLILKSAPYTIIGDV